MLRILAIVSLLSTASVTAQDYRWIPGIDYTIRVYAETTKEGGPGPLINVLGYDRDTSTVSLLFPDDSCYIVWWWRPSAGQGAITHIVQIGPKTFALYHESGAMRLEPRPDASYCIPAVQP